MRKFVLSAQHLKKRNEKKHFVLRLDIFGTFLQREMSAKDYFDFTSSFPNEADKILIDGMYSGDWYSVYKSDILPLRHNVFLDKWRDSGIDIYKEWIKIIKDEKGKECWLTHRISEVDIETDQNPITVKKEHPEWFIPAFGHLMNNLAVKEIREHKLKVLSEVTCKYRFDGLDIDFERHTPILPVGKQWEMRECVTEFMRALREETLKIGKEQGRVIMLSARVPDCLKGCHEDGLDIEQWIKENLVDCLTLGSRSFDIKVEEIRALSNDIQIYGCYDPHHTVDGYTFPPIETLRGIWYSHLMRGADGIEYFNWTGEGKKELVEKYISLYNLDNERDGFIALSNDDFKGITDKEFLASQDKTYVIDRKGGYPWGIGYGNLNADRQLPCVIDGKNEVKLYVAENTGAAKKAILNLVFEKLTEMPEICFNGQRILFKAQPYRDLQITTEKEAPISGYTVSVRIMKKIDMSKPCTMLTADVSEINTEIGYNVISIITKIPIRFEKAELQVKMARYFT